MTLKIVGTFTLEIKDPDPKNYPDCNTRQEMLDLELESARTDTDSWVDLVECVMGKKGFKLEGSIEP